MANFEIIERIDVEMPNVRYPVVIQNSGLHCSGFLRQHINTDKVMIVSNDKVKPLYLNQLVKSLNPVRCDWVILPDGEQHKSQDSLNSIYDALVRNNHHRDTVVIALGGGVIGDMAGFAASTYQRGVGLIHIPTTLLAQIDSSVGGKTGINHACGKNLIGTFYQPGAVLVDVGTLSTLPVREFRAGIAEMIKYALLEGGEFCDEVEQSLRQGLTHESPQLPSLISQCIKIKAKIVAHDEKEQGNRALLNLGHTFAHALETYTQYQQWLHGEAVAIGLYCAAILSWKMGIAESSLPLKVKELLELAQLPVRIPSAIDSQRLMQLMKLDKKILNNRLRFVVIKKPGHCYLENKVAERCLHDTLITAVEGE